MKKKILATLLAITIVLLSLPLCVFTVSATATSGNCGETLTWSYNTSTKTLTISGTGEMSDYSVSSYNGTYITSAPWRSYYNSMQKLVINNNITSIGWSAFSGCTGLTSVTIGNSVTYIGGHAFEDCNGLTSIIIPDSVTTIDDEAFEYSNLTTVIIPRSVTKIGRYAFYCCPLSYIGYKGTAQEWYDIEIEYNGSYFYDADRLFETDEISTQGDYLYSVSNGKATILEADKNISGDVSIPSTLGGYPVVSIYEQAFYGRTNLSSVTVPDSVTSIGDYAFYGCTGLTNVKIGNSVTEIGDSAFSGCTGLTSIIIPDSVTSIGWSAFSGCTGLTSVTIGNSVTSIGQDAFKKCTALTSVTIGNSVTYIGCSAFEDCDGLTSIILPSSLTKIDDSAFEYCSNLTTVIIPKSVTYIADLAFSGCQSLSYVGYKGTEQEWDIIYFGRANYNLTGAIVMFETDKISLRGDYIYSVSYGKATIIDVDKNISGNIIIPSTLGDYPVVSIYKRVFYENTNLTSVTIPDSVTSIGDSAFYGCTRLTYAKIGNSVTDIDFRAFYGCTGLTSIIIPDSVTSIGDSIFYGCTSLKNVIIGNSVTEIDEDAFYGCTSLTSITFPDSLTLIDNSAFYFTGLTSINVNSGNPKYHSAGNCLIETNSKTLILGCKNSIIPADGSVTTISANAFYGCTSLTSITIPDLVTSIGYSAFSNCPNLKFNTYDNAKYLGNTQNPYYALIQAKDNNITSCTVNDSTKIIAEAAFQQHKSLCYISIGNSVTSIGALSFYECTALNNVEMGRTVTSIGEYAFWECKSLTTFIIPWALKYVGENAFAYCSSLIDVYYNGTPEQKTKIYFGNGNSNLLSKAKWHYNQSCNHENNEVRKRISASCTASGYTGDTYCLDCGELILSGSAIPALGHDYVTSSTAPTCTAGGVVTSICSRCSDVKTETILPKGHTVVTDPAIEVTCTTDGKTQGSHCSVCNTVITAQIIIPALGHDYNTVVKKPTCTEGGYTTYTCRRCNDIKKSDYTSALGHDWVENAVMTELTCTTNGEVMYTCRSCGAIKNEITVAKGHSYGTSWKTDGMSHWHECSVCHEKKDFASHTLVGGMCRICGYGNRIYFPDIDYTAWYGEAVEYAVGAGLMKGYANGKFGTSDGIQRQDFIVILARLSGANLDNYANKTNFKDAAKGAYYYTALAWAKAEGVSNGYDNSKFGVGDKVTREQIVTFLYNYAKLMGYDTTATLTETEVRKTYSDYGKVSSFAKEATLWALSKGVISGKETRTGKQIAPQANAQRCEVAKMFFNISENAIFE